MPSRPLLGYCGCGCGSALCDFKVLIAVIPPASSVDGTGSYCPGTYSCTGGDCVTNCSSVANIVAWLNNQFTYFQSATPSGFGSYAAPFTGYAWNTYTTAFFTDPTSANPYSVTGPGPTTGYGSPVYGSGYESGSPLIALEGPSVGNVCAFAQLVAMNMSGNLFLTSVGVYEASGSCLATPPAPYFIPMPPFDDCASEYPDLATGGGIQTVYLPFQTANSVDCLPAFSGDYTACQSPDPFFGDDPP